MSKKKGKRQQIEIQPAIDLLEQGYSCKVKIMTPFQFRIWHEEDKDTFWDWYHTSGALVRNRNGYYVRCGTAFDVESVALVIKNETYQRV